MVNLHKTASKGKYPKVGGWEDRRLWKLKSRNPEKNEKKVELYLILDTQQKFLNMLSTYS